MSQPNRPAPMFVGESTALDFLNSIATPKKQTLDWLADGDDVLNWMVQAGICEAAQVAHLAQPEHAQSLQNAVGEIRIFREEFRRFIQAASDQGEVSSDDPMIDRINAFLGQGSQFRRIEATTDAQAGFTLSNINVFDTPDDLLPLIASACAELICEADFQHVRNCEGPTCTMFFHDISKNHKRRWCTMDICGNRAKAAAHRKAKSRAGAASKVK